MRLLLLLSGFLPSVAFADSTVGKVGSSGNGISAMWSQICSVLPCSVAGNDLLSHLAGRIIAFVFPLVSGIAVIMVIYAGLRIIFSGGKDEAVTEAKKIILYAALGVIFSLLASSAILFADWLLQQLIG